MSIYRGAGGAGDAVADSSSEALLIRSLVIEAQADADAAAASATAASGSASSASTSATNAAASAATIDVSSFLQKASNLSDLASTSTARTNLGLGTAATTASTAYATAAQGTAADTAFADRLKWDGGATDLIAATGRTSLGLGTIATQAASAVAITGGSISGITDLAVADGGTGASSITANSIILGNGSSALSGNLVAPSTSGNVLTSNGTTWISSALTAYPLTNGTAVASTSGTSIDFTSIPSWVKRVTVMFAGVSQNSATQTFILQIGAGSVTTSGYTSSNAFIAPSTASGNVTTGFPVNRSSGAEAVFSGVATICFVGSNVWANCSTMADVTNGQVHFGAGSLSLGGTLDRVRVTTIGGTATFDAGTINILYE